jgi:hypothetical protein
MVWVMASFSCTAWGGEDGLLSVSASEAIAQRSLARIVPAAPAATVHHHPELLGCVLVGAWAMYKSRRRRII